MKGGMDQLVVTTQTFLRSVLCEISLNTRLALNVGVLKHTILQLDCLEKVLEWHQKYSCLRSFKSRGAH